MGGNSSPVCSLSGPSSLFGFKCRGLGPTEPRRQTRDIPYDDFNAAADRDALGGDLAVSAFADLSFDLPLRILKEAGIHGHIFAAAGNLVKITENEWQKISPNNFMQSFRSTVGCGIIVPTKLFRLEVGIFYSCSAFACLIVKMILIILYLIVKVNYCHLVRRFEHDHGKTGVQIGFSSPF